ncbi:hypothetical protein BDA96_02G150500 [Sorghum bicolor]|uniref:Uncharacterized protein n=2 Tax=Sorghum bicolor TaxID=4558 RepID=A0A921RQ23_SORBI|nr:hypothetical protein BDA96_02G150500 [Sorghum bicolor]KXG35189.1 hypothetical protein SORBI_3002G144400 [Sorghum bicolor]
MPRRKIRNDLTPIQSRSYAKEPPLAPTVHHNLASSRISCITVFKLGRHPSKTITSMLPNLPCHRDNK